MSCKHEQPSRRQSSSSLQSQPERNSGSARSTPSRRIDSSMKVKLVGSVLTSFLPRRISSAVRDALRWIGYSSWLENPRSWQW